MVVFDKPHALTEASMHYCPGCTHGIIHRLVAEALEELGVTDKTVGVASVGCSVFSYNYFNCDMCEFYVPHCNGEHCQEYILKWLKSEIK